MKGQGNGTGDVIVQCGPPTIASVIAPYIIGMQGSLRACEASLRIGFDILRGFLQEVEEMTPQQCFENPTEQLKVWPCTKDMAIETNPHAFTTPCHRGHPRMHAGKPCSKSVLGITWLLVVDDKRSVRFSSVRSKQDRP